MKGHGTENDFVVLPDLDGALDSPRPPSARCATGAPGIGADGVLRVVRTENARGAAMAATRRCSWTTATRTARVAEMCGNGIRVFVRYLVDAGLR